MLGYLSGDIILIVSLLNWLLNLYDQIYCIIAGLDKPNQDSYSVVPQFGGDSKRSFFGIYDGHGKEGHSCAWFVRDNVSFYSL